MAAARVTRAAAWAAAAAPAGGGLGLAAAVPHARSLLPLHRVLADLSQTQKAPRSSTCRRLQALSGPRAPRPPRRELMPQDVGKVLAEAFGRTGATALQYSAEFRFLVQQHITELVQVRGQRGSALPLLPAGRRQHPARCRRRSPALPVPAHAQDLPSLHIKTRDYTQNDGRCAAAGAGCLCMVGGRRACGAPLPPPLTLRTRLAAPQDGAPDAGGGHGADVLPGREVQHPGGALLLKGVHLQKAAPADHRRLRRLPCCCATATPSLAAARGSRARRPSGCRSATRWRHRWPTWCPRPTWSSSRGTALWTPRVRIPEAAGGLVQQGGWRRGVQGTAGSAGGLLPPLAWQGPVLLTGANWHAMARRPGWFGCSAT